MQCQEVRQGKTAALNLAVSRATAEIIVFADANSFYAPGALRALVRSFADPSVGAVTGVLLVETSEEGAAGAGVGLYWRIETSVRKSESRVDSVVGATGAIYAIRRRLFAAIPAVYFYNDITSAVKKFANEMDDFSMEFLTIAERNFR